MANLFTETSVYPTDIEQRKKHYQAVSDTLAGRIQVRSFGVSRREFTIIYPPMTRDSFSAVWDFIDNLQGGFTTFEIYVPSFSSGGPVADVNWATGDGLSQVTVRLKNDIQEFSIDSNLLYSFEIDCVEVLS